jgi:rod shape-determining protein MreC
MRTLTRRQRLAAGTLAALCLLFISLDLTGNAFAGAHDGVSGAFGSLYRGTDFVLGPTRRFIQGIPDVGRNRSEIARLEEQNTALRRQLTTAQVDTATARQLKALQLQADSAGWRIVPARVVATSPGSGFQKTLTVDAGSTDGLVVNQTVTDGAGLLGRIIEIHRTTAVVLLVSDPDFGVGVRDNRTGTLLLGKGTGSSALEATTVTGVARGAVRPGDVLTTGPADATTFVSGVAVGTVASVRSGPGGVLTAVVHPAADEGAADLVSIIVGRSRSVPRPRAGGDG